VRITERWLVRFGYDGAGFSGWARQPGLRTVEEVIREGLRLRGVAVSLPEARLEVASRTDRGVSARANALTVSTRLSAPQLLHRLNAISPELFFTAASSVPPGFRVRAAKRRVYRYFEVGAGPASGAWEKACRLFRGPVDVRSFGRGLSVVAPVWRSVDSVTTEPRGDGRVLEVRAPSFVWGMVRKIVGALREVELGRLTLQDLESALQGHRRLTLPLAEPEGLVLWEVEYPSVRWESRWPGPTRHQAAYFARLDQALWRRQAVVTTLIDATVP